jgi:hypothetical protein
VNVDFLCLYVSNSGGLRKLITLAGRTGSSDRKMHMCFFHILQIHNLSPDAEAIYKLWQLLSEGTLIKAMTVLMLSLEVNGVPLIVYWGSL